MIKRTTTVALAFAALTSATANAKTFEVTYDWNKSSHGFAGWDLENVPQPDLWYSSSQTVGSGLKISPNGHAGDDYDDASSRYWWWAPPGSNLRKASLEGLNGRAYRGQLGRAYIFRQPDSRPSPTGSIREILGTGEEWTNERFSLFTPSAEKGVGFGLWMFTRPCSDDTSDSLPNCVPSDPADGANVKLAKVKFKVDDPSAPQATVEGLSKNILWARSTDLTLKVNASDPQSGIARVEAKVSSATGTRTYRLGRWKPDTKNRVPRAPGTSQLAVQQQVERELHLSKRSRAKITVTTKNGARAKTKERGVLRIDRVDPDFKWPRRVKAGRTAKAQDRESGVASVVVKFGDTTTELCKREGRSCRFRLPAGIGSRQSVTVVVTDLAGNSYKSTKKSVRSKRSSRSSSPGFCNQNVRYTRTVVGQSSFGGDARNEYIKGSKGNDFLNGGDGDDCVDGSYGEDTLSGGDGNDVVRGGKDIDSFSGGEGNDLIYARDGTEEVVICGPGIDTAIIDQQDLLYHSDCENVRFK